MEYPPALRSHLLLRKEAKTGTKELTGSHPIPCPLPQKGDVVATTGGYSLNCTLVKGRPYGKDVYKSRLNFIVFLCAIYALRLGRRVIRHLGKYLAAVGENAYILPERFTARDCVPFSVFLRHFSPFFMAVYHRLAFMSTRRAFPK